MGILDETQFIERIQFFDGERLFADDLQGLEAFNREMRWLHNQSLHQPGIGKGFAVTGKKGDKQVRIGAGYAIDSTGREIVLTHDMILPVPPVASEPDGSPITYDLTVSYPDDASLKEAETRNGVCAQPGVIRLREEPVFCWARLGAATGQPVDVGIKNDILSGARIIIAQVEVLNCQLNKDVSVAQRLSARPPVQPYIRCGLDDTKWKTWTISDVFLQNQVIPLAAEGTATLAGATASATAASFSAEVFPAFISPIGLTATVDTSSAGFLTTPAYTARIDGPRIKQVNTGGSGASNVLNIAVDGLIQITDPGAAQFTIFVLLVVDLLLPARATGSLTPLALLGGFPVTLNPQQFQSALDTILALFSDWKVEWMGVEG
jgi:hypothetical protein